MVVSILTFCCLRQVADLSMGDLLLHTSVTWINPPASLGKWKKEPQMAAFGRSFLQDHLMGDVNKET